jgi:ComF family protein
MSESLPDPTETRSNAVNWFRAAFDALASVFLPADCRICNAVLTSANRVPICQPCLSSIPAMPARICDVCGQPLESFERDREERIVCPSCKKRPLAFTCARSVTIYEDAAISAILLLKYERMEPLGTWFAQQLATLVRSQGDRFAADMVVPVPLHKTRERARGFNQASLLAKPLARELRLPYRPVLLQRIRQRPWKRVLTAADRWEAVRGAFATRPGSQVDNLRVLLVDDVLTTGATLDACAKALIASGAQSVVGLTVARAARSPVTKTSPGSNRGSQPEFFPVPTV